MRLLVLVAVLLAASLSAGVAVRTFALPTEARTTEAWYSYKSSIGFDYTATVKTGRLYPSGRLTAAELARVKLPVEPPQFHRVLLSKLVESLEVRVPYHFEADRAAPVTATLKWEARLGVPGVWERPYPIGEPRTFKVTEGQLIGAETLQIPISSLLAEMEAGRQESGIGLEPAELRIRPIFEVRVEGLRQPVAVSLTPEFLVSMRSATVEIDEPRESRQEKTLTETRVTPVVISLFGRDVTVASLREISVLSLSLCLVLGLTLLWLRRVKADDRAQLKKLGPGLIVAQSLELPPDTAVAGVSTVRELLHLHMQTERPVIQVGKTCYLFDGTICYRLVLEGEERGPVSRRPPPGAGADVAAPPQPDRQEATTPGD